MWWRLDLDPQRLTQWNLNLRLVSSLDPEHRSSDLDPVGPLTACCVQWIHVTILERLVRWVRAADEALARLALCEAGALREGRVAPARLRALAAHAPALAPLLPFLEPFPDQRYVVRRISGA